MPPNPCPHCGGDLSRPAVTTVTHFGADGQPLPPEEAMLRSRALAALLEERTGWHAGRRGL